MNVYAVVGRNQSVLKHLFLFHLDIFLI